MRKLFIILTIFSFQQTMAQEHNFSGLLNKLFFGADISTPSASLLDSLKKKPELAHVDDGVRQINLNTAMRMGTEKAVSSRHKFTFVNSPISGYTINIGVINMTLGEAAGERRLISLDWQAGFQTESDAKAFFKHLTSQFAAVSKWKKEAYEQEVGLIAQFTSADTAADGPKAIYLFLGQMGPMKEWTVALDFGNEQESN